MGVFGEEAAEVFFVGAEDFLAEAVVVAAAVEGAGEDDLAQRFGALLLLGRGLSRRLR